MGQLTNQYVSQSYQGLLKLQDSTTGVTSTLQYVQDGVGNNIPIQVSTSSVVITGSFRGDGSGLTGITANVDSGSLVTTSSFNAYTSSNDSKVNSLISQTGSYVTETESGSFVTNVQQGIIPSIVTVTKGNGTTSQFTIDNVVSSSFAQNALSASYAPTILPSGVISGSQQIADLGYATTSSVTSLSQSIAVTDLAQDGRLTALETFTGSINTGYVSETEFGTYTSSMNNFTTSIDGRVDALEIATGSLQNQINQKLDTGSFNSYTSSTNGRLSSLESTTSSLQNQINQKLDTGSFNTYSGSTLNLINQKLDSSSFNSYTSSNDAKVNSLISQTGSYVTETESGSFMTTGSVAGDTLTFTKGDGSQFSLQISVATGSLPAGVVSGSQQIVDLGFATTSSVNTKLDTGSFNTYSGNTLNLINTKLDSSSFNSYTSSNDAKVNSLISATGSYATTGSNIFQGTQTITGSLNVTNEITALSASITYLQTIYQTSSVIFTSGSNILGDEPSDVQTLNGRVDIPLGNLNVTGSTTSSLGFFGDLQGTASFASNALSSSHSVNADTASYVLNAVSSSYSDFALSSSFAQNAISSSHAINADNSISSSQAQNAVSASYSLNSTSASFAQTSVSSSFSNFAVSSSQAQNAVSSSYALSSSFSDNATNASDIRVYVKNVTGTQIDKGKIVRITGATGDNALIALASFEDDNNSANTLGWTGENIPNDAFGWVYTQGTLLGVNTSGYTPGQVLYLSSSGNFTGTIPPAPYHEVRLGQVLRAQQNNGSVYVSIQNGYELEELHDVDIISPVVGDVLTYVSGSYGQWENKTVAELGYLQTSSFNTYTGDTLNLINQKLDTGSFNSYTSSTNGRLDSIEAQTGSYATTSSLTSLSTSIAVTDLAQNGRLNSLESFTGSIDTNFVSEVEFGAYTSSNDGKVNSLISATGSYATTGSNVFRGNQTITGSINVSGNTINNTNGVNTQYLGSTFGGNVGAFNVSNNTEVGLALDGATWTTNWSTGPILYVNNTPGDTYEAVFGFQNKANYTDGRVTVVKPIVFNAGATGSLEGTASFATTASFALNATTVDTGSLMKTGSVLGNVLTFTKGDGSTFDLTVATGSGGGSIDTGSFATTGSNRFVGNQTITGSLIISSSAGLGLSNTDGVNTEYFGNSFGGNIGINKNSDFTEIGLALDGASWTTNWSTGPIMYVNNTPGDTYEGVFGFQNKSNYTDGRITALKPMVFNSGATITGSFNVTGSSTLSGNGGFPLNVDGTINSKRLHFDKNPFNNDPSSNLGALRLDGFNQTFYLTNYDLADFANKQSVVGLFVNTGSNTANTYLHSLYNGTTAKAELMNFSGSRTFRVDVDSSAFTGSLTVSGGITGSLEGTASFATTASFALNGGGGSVDTGSFATTGSNTFIGNQIITGSVLISGSAVHDLKVVGQIVSTGSALINTDNVNIQYLGSTFGGSMGIIKLSDNTEVGLALDGAQWTTNWSNGPLLYVNNTPGDTYEGVFGFQDKTNYTDGRVTTLKPMVFNSGATGSFYGDGSGLTGITASAPNNVATTGSNVFIGNQTITGSVLISGSAAVDLKVVGNIVSTGSSLINTDNVNIQYLGSSFGGNLGVLKISDNTEVGLALDGASWTGNWSTGPILYVNNNPGDTYDAVFGFQNKTNFTDGRVTVLKPMVFNAGVTGSLTVDGQTTFQGNNGFPVNVLGTLTTKRFAFSGNPFNSTPGGTYGSLNYDGTNTTLFFVNGDFGTPQTSSYLNLTTNTGSNVTQVVNGADYAGTSAKTTLDNNNGTRTFTVDVNRTSITGSLAYTMPTIDITVNVTGSIDLNVSNTFLVNDDGNPAGGHLIFSNHRDGQQVTILFNNTGASGQSITLQGGIQIAGNNSNQVSLDAGYNMLQGVCYGGVFYGAFTQA